MGFIETCDYSENTYMLKKINSYFSHFFSYNDLKCLIKILEEAKLKE